MKFILRTLIAAAVFYGIFYLMAYLVDQGFSLGGTLLTLKDMKGWIPVGACVILGACYAFFRGMR